MNLRNKNNNQLIAEVKTLVSKEKELVAEVLEYLKEVEVRRLHLARGYSSMFAFCTEFLKYSDAEAHIRIQAMRLMRVIPEVKEKIESGRISLSTLAMAQGHFKREEKRRKEEALPAMLPIEKAEIVKSLENTSTRKAEHLLAVAFPLELQIRDKIKPVSEEKVRIEFLASKLLAEKIEKLKGLMAHKNYEGRLDLLFEKAIDIALEKLLKKTELKVSSSKESPIVKEGGNAGGNSDTQILGAPQVRTPNSHVARSRYISVQTKRTIWQKSKSECQYVDPVTRRKCNSRHALEVDHIHEFAKGGGNEARNLRLLCASHNKFRNSNQARA